MIPNLDFKLDQERAYQPLQKERILMTQCILLNEALERFILISQFSSLFEKRFFF